MGELLEITDLIVDFDPDTFARRPVDRDDVVARLRQHGQHRAANVVARLPAVEGTLDGPAIDRLLVRVHCEMQRLSEEFQHGRRVLELVCPVLSALAESGVPSPYRIVDIGCGTGFVTRWLAAHRHLIEHEVELLGVDFNGALIDEARRLSAEEDLPCHFEVINAFAMKNPATMYISTGVIHHFRGDQLRHFLAQHDQPATQAFAHFDFQPTPLAGPGSWLFHFIRMRESLSRHDGVVSARRAHHAAVLLEAARHTTFQCGMYSRYTPLLPLPRVFQTLIGIRPSLVDAFRRSLGPRAKRLESLS